MEIDNYRNFLAIVEAGSMTAASEFVHIAQPALSKQLKSLENYFGTKLIITTRGSKHLILTDAGKILYHKAKYICSLEDMAKNEIDDVSDGNRGTLRISAANSREFRYGVARGYCGVAALSVCRLSSDYQQGVQGA